MGVPGRLWLSCVMVFSVAVAPVCAGEATPEELLKQLSSEDFDARQNALRELEHLGDRARAVLERAQKSQDAEIRDAAQRLLAKLKKGTLLILAYDRDGKPAGGAQVELQIWNASGEQLAPESVTINADGIGKVGDRAVGTLGWNQLWRNWQPLASNYSHPLGSGTTVSAFVLTQGGTLNAVLLDPAGKPLRDARLLVERSAAPCDPDLADFAKLDQDKDNNLNTRLHSDSSDAEGKVALPGLADGIYAVYALHENYRVVVAPRVRVREGQATDLGSLKFAQPRKDMALDVTLLDDAGKPLKERQIWWSLTPVLDGPDGAKRWRKLMAEQRNVFGEEQPSATTGEDGRFTIDRQLVGKYELHAWTDNSQEVFGSTEKPPKDLTFEYREEITLSGEQTELKLTLKPAASGKLKGKLLSTEDRPVAGAQVELAPEEEIARLVALLNPDAWNNFDGEELPAENVRSVSSGENGEFELPRLAPGKYAALIRALGAPPALVYGIDVAVGKTATLPEVKLPVQDRGMWARHVKGKVTLPDGTPAANAQVTLRSPGRSWGTGVQGDGTFDFQGWGADTWQPEALYVFMKGYKPVTVHLQSAGVKAGELVVALKPTEYGTLQVRVEDAQGQPVAGVKVYPNFRKNQFWSDTVARARFEKTSAEGAAVFKGLAVGKRSIFAEAEGYYSEPVPVDIAAGKDDKIKLVLHQGLAIEAVIAAPPETNLKLTAVQLTGSFNETNRSLLVDATGRCMFAGLAPGKYTLQATAPGMLAQSSGEVTLAAGQKEPLRHKIKLMRPRALAIDLGKDSAFRGVSLEPASQWPESSTTPEQDDADFEFNHAEEITDAAGRFEAWGLPAGPLHVVLKYEVPDSRVLRGFWRNEQQLATQYSVGQVSAQPLESVHKLAELPGQKLNANVELQPVKFSVKPAGAVPAAEVQLNLEVVIRGAGALASGYASCRPPQPEQKPLEFGKRPAGFKLPGHDTAPLTALLPPGAYKLYVTPTWMRHGLSINTDSDTAKEKPRPLKEFVVEAGKPLDLGTLAYALPPIPPEAKDDVEQFEYWGDMTEDKVEVFKP